MESYLTTTKSTVTVDAKVKRKKRLKQQHLEARSTNSTSSSSLSALAGGIKSSNAPLLKQMGTDQSAITNSTAYERTLHVQSCATGHQSGGGPGGNPRWTVHRNQKLLNQAPEAKNELFKGLVFYINGLTGKSITNQQLKMLIHENGGTMRLVESASVTHAFVSNLSASKLHRVLRKKCNSIKYITPQWAIESVKQGKRMKEADFAAPIFAENQGSVLDHYEYSNSDEDLIIEGEKKEKKKRRLNHPANFETCHDVPPPSAAPVDNLLRVARPQKKTVDKDVETVELLSSSPVIIEERSKEAIEDSSFDEVDDELDEWGMPPSAQKSRSRH